MLDHCPAQVAAIVSEWTRNEAIDEHGFDERVIPIAWFEDRAYSYRTANIDVGLVYGLITERDSTGSRRISRGLLFDAARSLDETSSDEEVLRLFWSVVAWGSGRSSRGNVKRLAAFASPDTRAKGLQSLRTSAGLARGGETREAFRYMMERPGHINGVGSAFFTKWLYFAGGGSVDHRAVIFDSRVAQAFGQVGDERLAAYAGRDSVAYEAYCMTAQRWGWELSSEMNRVVGADEIEKALWQLGAGAWSG